MTEGLFVIQFASRRSLDASRIMARGEGYLDTKCDLRMGQATTNTGVIANRIIKNQKSKMIGFDYLSRDVHE